MYTYIYIYIYKPSNLCPTCMYTNANAAFILVPPEGSLHGLYEIYTPTPPDTNAMIAVRLYI